MIHIENFIDVSMYKGAYKDLAEIIGHDAVFLVYKNFKGQQMSFPSKLLSTEYVIDRISKEYSGKNAKELARKYDYTYSWVMKLIKKMKSREGSQ